MADETSDGELSKLESLPGELLNRIYRYAVVEDKLVTAATQVDDENGKWQSNEPALARTCRQFRREVLPIYYAENIFKFPTLGQHPRGLICKLQVDAWLEAIGAARWDIVRAGANFTVRKVSRDEEDEVVRWEEVDVITTISHEMKQIETTFSQEFEARCECWLGRVSIWNTLGDVCDFQRLSYGLQLSHNFFARLYYMQEERFCMHCERWFDEN